jgi:hypothetical protein
MTTTETVKRMSNSELAKVLGRFEATDDCETCGWRIAYTPSLKVYFGEGDMAVYNHSSVVRVEKNKESGGLPYTATIIPWNRKPADPQYVEIDVDGEEVVHSDLTSGRSWEHVSSLHPDRLSKNEADQEGVKQCVFPRPHSRCSKCRSKHVKFTQGAYHDYVDCPECGYHSERYIGE